MVRSAEYLRGHSTPEVRIGCAGLEHRSDYGLILFHELPERIGVGEEVVAVGELHRGDGTDCEARSWRVKEMHTKVIVASGKTKGRTWKFKR